MPTQQSNQTVYYAHSGKLEDLSDGQTLFDHLSKVSEIAEQNAQWFGANELAKYAGLLHDLGKYCPEFLKRLQGGKTRVDHATAGAQIAFNRWQLMGKLLAYCIAGHHAGLANGIDEGDQRSTLDVRLKLEPSKDIPHLDPKWEQEIKLPVQLTLPALKPHKAWPGFQLAFLTRMIFSCLVDADRKDTNNYYLHLEGKDSTDRIYPSLPDLRERFNAKLEEIQQALVTKPPKSINSLRQLILDHSREKAQLIPGLFSLTVPTGGGKTYTSMAFALDHAITHQQRRIIYVIPFTSIIEQNAKVFREAFGNLADAIIEHHSAFDDTKLPNNNARDTLKRAMESWDAPVIVTTAVQFFESLFADRTSQCRKLHNIAGSVIILDEAQTLPLKLLYPIMAALDELALNYQCSIVLCTATQPALTAEHLHNGFENVREIAPNPPALFAELERVRVKAIGVQTDEQLLTHLREKEQVLIIVNNRRHARSLYDNMKKIELEGATHLTTLMCAKHRSQILKKVNKDLRLGKPCRVVSTSLIEAGVDVDFPSVLRAEAGLDSIAQAAGRCNREGKRERNDSEVLVFQSPDWKAPTELDQLTGNMREVLRNHDGNILSPDALKAYFNFVYKAKGDELDKKKILQKHNDHCRNLSFPFQNIARDFRMIETRLKPIIIEFDDNAEKLVRDLEFAENIGAIARQLQVYLVQIPENGFKELLKARAIAPIKPEQFGDQFWRLIDTDLYDKEAGLSWDNPVFIEAEKTII
ncbi:MAG: CRISPR-associated helicase Cas3' [Methyloglobulus sp.]|nr:CRISPR-associated helicase Cas3' [Methyloglobulus sp.]